MKKYLQIFLSLSLCAILMLSCGCTFNFWNNDDKEKGKNPSSSQQDENNSSDDGLLDDESSEDTSLNDDLSDNSSDKNDKETSSKKEYDKYNPVSSSGNIMPTVKDQGKNDNEKDEEDQVFTDSVKYPNSVNAEALNKTDLFDAYDTALFTEKIWEGKTVYYETICFEQDKNGFISDASLLYEPDEIIAVRSADMKITYSEGKDYTVNGRVLSRPRSTSTAPFLSCKSSVFVPYTGGDRQYQLAADPSNAIYFHPDGKVHQKNTLTVFYTHKDGWRGNTMPESQEDELSRAINKLKNGEDLKIVFHGDSITSGYTTSGDKEDHRSLSGNLSPHSPADNYAPYVSAYPSMVTEALKLKFPSANITKVNTAAPGGQSGSYGLEHIDLVKNENPDLVVIAFGMNDSWMDTGNNHGRYYYKNFYIQMMNKVLETNPDCEFIFVPCMLPNMALNSFLMNDASFDSHERHLYEIQKEYPDNHIAVVPTTSLWRDFYALGKKPSDYTGALDNHPNDWGHSIYAQLILNAFGI